MELSVIIPVYNEKNYILKVLAMVQKVGIPKEIIVVDDCSTDGTREILKEFSRSGKDFLRNDNILVLFHEANLGKGAALRTGFEKAKGNIIVIQDADLEYDPEDWHEMYLLIKEDRADVVFGSRFIGKSHRVLYFHHYLGNRAITFLVDLLCNINLSDVEACYKMFRREVLRSLTLTANDFGFEVEFAIKTARQKALRIYETGVKYYGRSYSEGKKINWIDGAKALWYIIRYKFF